MRTDRHLSQPTSAPLPPHGMAAVLYTNAKFYGGDDWMPVRSSPPHNASDGYYTANCTGQEGLDWSPLVLSALANLGIV